MTNPTPHPAFPTVDGDFAWLVDEDGDLSTLVQIHGGRAVFSDVVGPRIVAVGFARLKDGAVVVSRLIRHVNIDDAVVDISSHPVVPNGGSLTLLGSTFS